MLGLVAEYLRLIIKQILPVPQFLIVGDSQVNDLRLSSILGHIPLAYTLGIDVSENRVILGSSLLAMELWALNQLKNIRGWNITYSLILVGLAGVYHVVTFLTFHLHPFFVGTIFVQH